MASASTSDRKLLSNDIDINKGVQCSYCKATRHFWKNCQNLKKKERNGEKTGKKPHRQTYPPCETCGEKNYPTERCWQGTGAHVHPERTQPCDKANDASVDEGTSKKANFAETSTSGQSNSKKLDSKN